MPKIEENKLHWNERYNWHDGGDEWSAQWGGPYMQWQGTIFPRIKPHVPTDSILEIACGFGRWTQYLKDLCEHLFVIDLSEKCITACKQRFSEVSHIQYHVNDGKSLEMIPDDSADFVFSFDSLVHADDIVMDAYLSQLPRILKKDGVAFIHHSNLGAYHTRYARIYRFPKLKRLLTRIGIIEKELYWRDFTVDARKVEALAERHGLRCIRQEIVLWRTKKTFIDCMSTMVRSGSTLNTTNQIYKNANFMHEAQNLLQLSRQHDPDSN